MFTNEKKHESKFWNLSRKKYASRFEKKKKTRVEKGRTLTSCDINRCLHFTETRFRSKVVVSWLPNIAEFFFSLARLIEDLERQLSSASYDSSEFLFRRLDEYKRTREVKSQLAEIQITKPKHNLSRKDRQALKELQQNTGALDRYQADKRITTVDTNKTDKIREGQIQIDDEHNYKPLVEPMLKETQSKVKRLINYGKHNDEMTR